MSPEKMIGLSLRLRAQTLRGYLHKLKGRAPHGARPLLFFKMFCGVFSAQRAEIALEDQARRDGVDRLAVLFLLAAVGV